MCSVWTGREWRLSCNDINMLRSLHRYPHQHLIHKHHLLRKILPQILTYNIDILCLLCTQYPGDVPLCCAQWIQWMKVDRRRRRKWLHSCWSTKQCVSLQTRRGVTELSYRLKNSTGCWVPAYSLHVNPSPTNYHMTDHVMVFVMWLQMHCPLILNAEGVLPLHFKHWIFISFVVYASVSECNILQNTSPLRYTVVLSVLKQK